MISHTLLRFVWLAPLALAACVGGARPGAPIGTDSTPLLGSATHFAVLAGSAVTNTGATLVEGNLGVHPGTAITGFPPGLVTLGTVHSADAFALQAKTDLTATYTALSVMPCTQNLTGMDLGALTLTPGVYCFDTSAGLTGTLTLDGQGNPDSIFVFKTGSTLTTATDARVVLLNQASPCNVYWQVGSSATLGTRTTFIGRIVALTSITLNTGASVVGGTLARNGAVTLDGNAVSQGGCLDRRPRDVTPDGGVLPVPGYACTECGVQGCVDLSSNAYACGACGNACQLDYHCVGGSCSEFCE